MCIDWTDYRQLDRSGKAVLMNRHSRSIEAFAKQHGDGDVSKEHAITTTTWMLLFCSLQLTAAEIAEALLLCQVPFPFADWDGNGPHGAGVADEYGNDVIDRAMFMASQWHVDGYPDCFCTHEIGHTELGRVDDMRRVAKAGGMTTSFAHATEAGALAAKAACDVHNFTVMTEGYRNSRNVGATVTA